MAIQPVWGVSHVCRKPSDVIGGWYPSQERNQQRNSPVYLHFSPLSQELSVYFHTYILLYLYGPVWHSFSDDSTMTFIDNLLPTINMNTTCPRVRRTNCPRNWELPWTCSSYHPLRGTDRHSLLQSLKFTSADNKLASTEIFEIRWGVWCCGYHG